ncbi:Alpha/Beta hydrolase protein [Aspergillus stella-maris]|uniref:Alpha/Beta hydrolase protein n=1 Tax=Aspergillus stella-maris TaxID=1810926 RepID=UPI003CCCF062
MPPRTLLHLLALTSTAIAIPPPLQIQTTSGLVHEIYNDTSQTVRAFLGIPYAEAPINDLHFAPPVAKTPSDESQSIDVSKFGNELGHGTTGGLNTVSKGVDVHENKAVSILLTEKNTTLNSGTESDSLVRVDTLAGLLAVQGLLENGLGIVKEHGDVLVVTFNYRLNVFGFPNAHGLELEDQNVGFLDQRLEIEWMHRNIANFGGDPDRILLFGQSYRENPLVSAIALLSGSNLIFPTFDSVHSNWNNVATALGCGTGEVSLPCMRAIPWEDIVDKMGNNQYAHGEAVHDNSTSFEDYAKRARGGEVAHIPTLAEITAREFSAMIPLSSTSPNETMVTETLYTQFSCPLSDALRLRMEQDIPT